MDDRKIRLRPSPRYPEDCRRIVDVMSAAGYSLSPRDAEEIWEEYSESMAAGWMGLPDDDHDLVGIVCFYAEVDDRST